MSSEFVLHVVTLNTLNIFPKQENVGKACERDVFQFGVLFHNLRTIHMLEVFEVYLYGLELYTYTLHQLIHKYVEKKKSHHFVHLHVVSLGPKTQDFLRVQDLRNSHKIFCSAVFWFVWKILTVN